MSKAILAQELRNRAEIVLASRFLLGLFYVAGCFYAVTSVGPKRRLEALDQVPVENASPSYSSNKRRSLHQRLGVGHVEAAERSETLRNLPFVKDLLQDWAKGEITAEQKSEVCERRLKTWGTGLGSNCSGW